MKKVTSLSVVIILLLFAVSAFGWQERTDLLDKKTYMEMETVGSPNISPDGNHILFTTGFVDKINDRRRSNIWVSDFNGTRIRMMTEGNWSDSSPVWSPDGTKIAFISDRHGTSQLYVMWFDTKEILVLTNLERAPGSIRWSPDGSMIAFTSFTPDTKPILPVKLPKRPSGAKWAKPAVIVDRLSWQRDGRGPVAKGYTHIYTIDAVLGGTPKQITSGDYSHSDPQWSGGGSKIYVSAIRKPEPEYQNGDSEIYSVDINTLEVVTLTNRKGPDRGQRISPDGRWIAYTGYDNKNYTSHLSNLYLMDSNGNGKKVLADNLPNSPSGVTWDKDGKGVYYLMAEKGVRNLYHVSIDGDIEQLTEGNHYLTGISFSKNDMTAATISDYYDPGSLYSFKLNKFSDRQKLVDINKDILAGKKLGEVEEMWFKSPDGLDLQGWLMKPVDYEPGKKYPMLLYIHGGPWSMYTVRFNWAWQNFAANGYAVLYMNPRGSTGYGQDFVNGIQYSYPGKDYDDLMAAVDAAIAKGFIDEDNLFVCGGSGGGVLTAWIVGHTERFCAAVSMRPVINWHSFVGNTDGASWYRQFRKYPWQDPMEFAVRSPLHYVANVTTPTMVMTGEADLRTPMPQSEEYYRALKMLKKETLLVRMPNEYHGWRRP
ncbi:MAG: S9 family peptidase, partial [bacterium]|nr:S9 family peptidase [bacterium]